MMRIKEYRDLERTVTRAANKMERSTDYAEMCSFCRARRPKMHKPYCPLRVEIQKLREWAEYIKEIIREVNGRKVRKCCVVRKKRR